MQGDVAGSLTEFDKAMELDPRQKACRFFNVRKMPKIYLFAIRIT